MNLDQMLYLVELDRSATISQAAKNLSISQAGLSQSLDKLEAELGVKLFNRTRNGTSTTLAGKQIINHAMEIENQLGMMRKVADKQRLAVDPPLRIGVMNEVPKSLLNWLLQFQDNHPQFKASIEEANSQQIIESVKNDEYDLGLIAINKSHYELLNSLSFNKIGQGQFKLYMTANHYLATYPDPIPINLIREQEFALFTDDYIPEFVSKIEKKYGALNVIVQSTAFRVILETMKKFQAVSIIRDSQIKNRLYDIQQSQLVERDLNMLDMKNDLDFQYGLINKPEKQFTVLQSEFIKGIKDFG
ncbi:hypothetical protein C5L31_002123 [Secundilactobacillus malefermentans]|uniref:HTH lysR-type domain-containing protein n=1 Tax=Secundilactobacillus malefermentans TaxID=176292 RepID=A0A4R5NSB1_9LACO|nr:LysR family transcriptional regulator [Secundilactobacillus malefermentans]KRM56242.1 fhu operon transcription regulator [Secundilactobacillus malefermentans DSM 5705 = KCTC 3548]TDG79904.1 hypothetical protein C5L31_002123 [Secundilactobacillus malefermentans]